MTTAQTSLSVGVAIVGGQCMRRVGRGWIFKAKVVLATTYLAFLVSLTTSFNYAL